MESESGMKTEGGSVKEPGVLSLLWRNLRMLEIRSGKCREWASGKEAEMVQSLTSRHQAIRDSMQELTDERNTSAWRDEHINIICEMVRRMHWQLMEIEKKAKGDELKEHRKLKKKQAILLKKMKGKSRKGTEGGSGKEQETWDLASERTKLKEKEREFRAKLVSESNKTAEEGDSGRKELVAMKAELRKLETHIGIKEQMKSTKLRKKQRKLLKSFGIVRGQEMGTDSGEHRFLIKDIISLQRERKDLLGSLTPTFSLWKEVDSQTTWTIATKEPATATATATAMDNENQLAKYFNLMLQDMEDLGHRMLSMLYFLNKSNDPICSYKATELCSTTARLNMQISKGFSTEPEPEPEPGQGQINLPSLFMKYFRFPDNYENTLAQLDMEEEKNKCEDVKVKKTKEEEDKENDPFTIEYFKKNMEINQYFFAMDRTGWEMRWASKIGRCGGFANATILSPMQFTHYTPGSIPSPAAVTGSTLQIYSIKIKKLKGLNWPLKVYGEVAARDTVDRNRNILFSRPKFGYQELNGEDDSLCLIGPSRAIVALGHVDFEFQLKVIEGEQSQRLIICRGRYGDIDDCSSSSASVTYGGDGPSFLLSNNCCTAEVTLEQLDGSHQATIVGIRVTKGDWPFKHGCRVICFWAPACAADVVDGTCRPIVLLDDRGKEIRTGSSKYLHLSRRVVSVESHGMLRVAIEVYGEPGQCIALKGHVDFPVKQCQTTALDCVLGDATVEVVVAWSLLVKEKVDLQVLLS